MKQVFTDLSTIAHMWANKTQDFARNSGNFYYEGDTIFSYGSHFPIAKHVKNSYGLEAVLFTERTYSNTTVKHRNIVSHAATHKHVIFCYSPNASHAENFSRWIASAENIASNLKTARKPEKYLNQISAIEHRVNMYVIFFHLEIPEKLKEVLSISNKSEYVEYSAKKTAYAKAEKERQEKENKARHKKELSEWLKGKTNRLFTRDGFDYLRVSGDNVETSQAVKMPVAYAKKLYISLKAGVMHVGSKVLDYEVTEVGTLVRIGCHTFKKDYLLKFGQKLA